MCQNCTGQGQKPADRSRQDQTVQHRDSHLEQGIEEHAGCYEVCSRHELGIDRLPQSPQHQG
jgi:hypothetical protein